MSRLLKSRIDTFLRLRIHLRITIANQISAIVAIYGTTACVRGIIQQSFIVFIDIGQQDETARLHSTGQRLGKLSVNADTPKTLSHPVQTARQIQPQGPCTVKRGRKTVDQKLQSHILA